MVLRPHADWALPKMDRYYALTWLFSARHWLTSNYRFPSEGAAVVLKEDLKTVRSSRQSNVRACAFQLHIPAVRGLSPDQGPLWPPGLRSAAGPPPQAASGATPLRLSQGVPLILCY